MGRLCTKKRGKYWEYSFEGAQINKKRNRISKCGFKTEKEALTAGHKALAEYNEAGLLAVNSGLSFSDFLDFWMHEFCEINLKNITIKNYEKKLKIHIKPRLGEYKLLSLSVAVLQKFINDKAKENFSRNSLISMKAILSGCLRFAVEKQIIKTNPMNDVRLPKPRNENIRPRTRPHVYIPRQKINEIFDRFPEGSSPHIPMTLGYKGGLRLGEAFACCWEDVDFQENRLTICRQVQWNEDIKTWYLSNPKYDCSRTIDLDQDTIDLLLRQKELQEKSMHYYDKKYIKLYVNKNKQLNTSGDGKIINLISVKEDGSFISPRIMQYTSEVIHYKMGYSEFDFHSFRHPYVKQKLKIFLQPVYRE